MGERKPIIDNPVYSEILIKINTKKIYTFDFIKKFKNKERSVLSRQLQVLKEMDYLIMDDVKEVRDKQEVKFKGNLKYYKVNWKRILLDFYEVLIIFATEKKEENSGFDTKKNYEKLKEKKFMHQLVNNIIFHDYIGLLLNEINNRYDTDIRFKDATLRNIFLQVLEMGLYVPTFDDLISARHIKDVKKADGFVYTNKDLKRKKEIDFNKLDRYLNDIDVVSEYYLILDSLGFGSKFYEDISIKISEKLEKKYVKA